MRFPFSRFSILQLLELTTIVAVSLAIDRLHLLWSGYGIRPLVSIIVIWGGIAGAYLGWRWSRERHPISLMSAAGVAAAVLTLLDATRVGVSIAESLRQATDGMYFGWGKDWPLLLGCIFAVTLLATALAPILVLIPIGISIVSRRTRMSEN